MCQRYLGNRKCQHLYLTYILILVDYVHSSGLKFSHEGEIRPHGGADKDVIKPITVDVTGGDSVAEVGADLISRQIVQICQVWVVEDNLTNSRNNFDNSLELQFTHFSG